MAMHLPHFSFYLGSIFAYTYYVYASICFIDFALKNKHVATYVIGTNTVSQMRTEKMLY